MMKIHYILIFVLALGISLLAAWYRFGDSAHAMGILTARGGSVPHPVSLEPDLNSYAVVVTAAVMPPWRGGAKVSLEGNSLWDWQVHASEPVVDLGVHRQPRWQDGAFHDLQPRDRLVVWLQLRRPQQQDPKRGNSPLKLKFSDLQSGKPLLEVPILFTSGEEGQHAQH